MSVGTLTAQGDWAVMPATKADLMLLQADLEGNIKEIRVDMANMGRGLPVRSISRPVLWGEEIQDLRDGIARSGVSMAWMTVGVATILGGLITLFQFLS